MHDSSSGQRAVVAPSPDPRIDFSAIVPAAIPALITGMPKAELHMHIEGSLEPELMFALAQKHGLALAHDSVEALRQAYAFDDLQSFLDIYYAGASVLLVEEDFYQMAWAYLKRAHAENIVHCELFFDPQTHTERGVSLQTVIHGLSRASQQAQREWGLSTALILCFLRHLSEDDAMKTLDEALPFREHFVGVGLDSSEAGHPPEKFSRVFARARTLGLKLVAHAGEEGPPEYVRAALDQLQVARIDHGVRSAEDPALLSRLAQSRVPLTVCPLSNIKLRVFNTMADHNFGELLEQGLCVTLNSDDPAYFGGYLNQNFLESFAALKLDARDAWQLAANSFEASFISAERRAALIRQLDDYFLKFVASR